MKPGIQEQGAKCGECREHPGMLTRILGILWEDSGEWHHFHILDNVEEDSIECSRRFWRMLVNILGIAWDDSGGLFKKILGNTQEDWTLYNAIKQKQNQRIIKDVRNS